MIDLLPHNIPTYEELCKQMENHNKCALVQATGTGKSYIIAKYLEEHPGKSLILVPTNAIGSQWEKLLSRTECDFTVDTYQGMSAHIDDEANYDIVVADEMHHLGSDVWGNAFINRFMQNVSQKVIGTTATEIRYLDNSRDMVEELFDGVAARGCDLKTAIEKGILPTFTYVSVWYGNDKDYEEYADKAKKIKDKTAKEQVLGKLELCKQNQKSIEQAIKENLSDEPHKIIVFLNSVDSMDNTEKAIKKAFSAKKTYKINSRMKKGTVNKNISDFENDNKRTTILYAIDMLNEGVHIDGVDVVAFLRTTESPAIYFQQLGRCLAVSKVNQKRTVFDFVCNSSNIKSLYNDGEKEEKGFINRINNNLPKERRIIIKDYIKELADLFSEIQNFINPLWSKEEILFIKEHSDFTLKELADALGRTEKAIQHFCSRNNLDYKRLINPLNTEWDSKKIEFLKENIADHSLSYIGNKLLMSLYEVRKKAIELGIYERSQRKNLKQAILSLGDTSKMSSVQIAKAIKGNHSSVYEALKRYKIPYKKRAKHFFTENEDDFIKSNVDMGSKWLSTKLGLSADTVTQRARCLGIEIPKLYHLSENDKKTIIKMSENHTAKEIAEKIGKSTSTIYGFCKDKKIILKRNETHKKEILMLDIENNELKRFRSITDAADFLGGSICRISKCLRGKAETAYGYRWKYA